MRPMNGCAIVRSLWWLGTKGSQETRRSFEVEQCDQAWFVLIIKQLYVMFLACQI